MGTDGLGHRDSPSGSGHRLIRCFGRAAHHLRPPSYLALRYSCTNWTTIAPSPTAEAMRLTEPDRTSPAANTPGRLVSSRKGGRRAVQWGDCARARPVWTNPLASLSIAGGNQSVCGIAPMKLNTAGVSTVHACPVL